MTKSQTYFYRNRGEWDWNTEFRVTDWKQFWKSSFPIDRKISFSLFILSQMLIGNYRMWTKVIYISDSSEVRHETRLTKFGMIFMKSKKTFQLSSDGVRLELKGMEYFWPFLSTPHPFPALGGSVGESTTRATYQMPLFGGICDCSTVLEPNQGEIVIETSWLRGKFTLTQTATAILNSRFEELPI